MKEQYAVDYRVLEREQARATATTGDRQDRKDIAQDLPEKVWSAQQQLLPDVGAARPLRSQLLSAALLHSTAAGWSALLSGSESKTVLQLETLLYDTSGCKKNCILILFSLLPATCIHRQYNSSAELSFFSRHF